VIFNSLTNPYDFALSLRKLHFSAKLSVALSISFYFITLLFLEFEKVSTVLYFRGVDTKHGNIFKRIRAYLTVLRVCLISLVADAKITAMSMKLKGIDYPYRKTTIFLYSPTLKDFVAILCVALYPVFYLFFFDTFLLAMKEFILGVF